MMESTYKYWFFYLLSDDNELYAYTDDKKLATKYMEDRDMDKYYMKVRKITAKEVNYLAREYQQNFLIEYTLKGKGEKNGRFTSIETDVVITYSERTGIEYFAQKSCDEIFAQAFINTNVFKGKLYDVLKLIYYTDASDFIYTGIGIPMDLMEKIKPDTVSIFISLYGNTLKVK